MIMKKQDLIHKVMVQCNRKCKLYSNTCICIYQSQCIIYTKAKCIIYTKANLSLSIGMVIRCFPISSYMCAVSFCICIVHVSIFISFLGLHSFIEMYASGIINGSGMCLVYLFCSSVKLAFIMFP